MIGRLSLGSRTVWEEVSLCDHLEKGVEPDSEDIGLKCHRRGTISNNCPFLLSSLPSATVQDMASSLVTLPPAFSTILPSHAARMI